MTRKPRPERPPRAIAGPDLSQLDATAQIAPSSSTSGRGERRTGNQEPGTIRSRSGSVSPRLQRAIVPARMPCVRSKPEPTAPTTQVPPIQASRAAQGVEPPRSPCSGRRAGSRSPMPRSLAGRPVERFLVGREQVEPAQRREDRGLADRLPRILQGVDDPGVAASRDDHQPRARCRAPGRCLPGSCPRPGPRRLDPLCAAPVPLGMRAWNGAGQPGAGKISVGRATSTKVPPAPRKGLEGDRLVRLAAVVAGPARKMPGPT